MFNRLTPMALTTLGRALPQIGMFSFTPTTRAFLARLLIFAVGTIAGMMLITAIIAVPITYLSNRFRLFHRYVASAAGVLSFVFGLFLVHHIWFLDRLFR
jgi:hypothetical protein